MTKLIVIDEEKHVFDFYKKILCNFVRRDNLIILSYIDLTSKRPDNNSIGISNLAVFDLERAEIIAEFELPTIFRAEPDMKILYSDGKVFLFSNKLNEYGNFAGESYLGVYAIKDNVLQDIVTMPNMQIFQIYERNSEIIVVETNGKVSTYDKNIDLKASFSIELNDTIRKVHLYDNVLYIATIDDKRNIVIAEYDIDSGSNIKKSNIPLPKSINWKYENFEFLPAI